LIKFIAPVTSEDIEAKALKVGHASPSFDLDTLRHSAIGAGAMGTVLYGVLAAIEKNRRL